MRSEMTSLECEILNIINETIEGKYVGKLRVTTEKNVYCLDLFMNHTLSPAISFIKECKDEDDFKDFIRKEIKSRKLEKDSYWTTMIVYPAKNDLVNTKKTNKFFLP